MPYVDAKITSMFQHQDVMSRDKWRELVTDIRYDNLFPGRNLNEDLHSYPTSDDGKIWFPDEASRWCTTKEGHVQSGLDHRAHCSPDCCAGFAGGSGLFPSELDESRGWFRCYRVDRPIEFNPFVAPAPNMNYRAFWQMSRPLGDPRWLCQWVSPWSPICGEDAEKNWNSPYVTPDEVQSGEILGEFYAGRLQVWFWNELQRVKSELYSHRRTAWEWEKMFPGIKISAVGEGYPSEYEVVERMKDLGWDYNVLHGRFDVMQFHCDPNKFHEEHQSPTRWLDCASGVNHGGIISQIKVGAFDAWDEFFAQLTAGELSGKTYTLPEFSESFDIQDDTFRTQSGITESGEEYQMHILPQSLWYIGGRKIYNPFWNDAMRHSLTRSVDSTMQGPQFGTVMMIPWAERHYWQGNGFKPFGYHDAGRNSAPRAESWRPAAGHPYRHYTFMQGELGEDGEWIHNPQPPVENDYGTFENPSLNCGTHDDESGSPSRRESGPHVIPYVGSNDSMNIDNHWAESEWEILDALEWYRDVYERLREEYGEDTWWERNHPAYLAKKRYEEAQERFARIEVQRDKCKVTGDFLVYVPDYDPIQDEMSPPVGPQDPGV